MDDGKFKELIARRNESAQALLDLLQAQRLDYPVESPFKARHFQALVKLSKRSQRYPECLVLEDMVLPPDPVAGGSFGELYKGSMGKRDVAIKVLRVYQKSDMNRILKAFAHEAIIWRQLSHQNVLQFYGLFHIKRGESERLCLACPWMKNGNLATFLSEIAPETDCVALANILVSDEHRACLADFGLSIPRETMSALFSETSTKARGTLNWTAPELLPDFSRSDSNGHETRQPDYASDVYSFAMGLREYSVINQLSRGKRPERPVDSRSRTRGLTNDIWNIIVGCWRQKPEERFTAAQVIRYLRALPDLLPDNRGLESHDMKLPSQIKFKQRQNPFAALEGVLEAERLKAQHRVLQGQDLKDKLASSAFDQPLPTGIIKGGSTGAEISSGVWQELKSYLEVQTELIVYATQSVHSGMHSSNLTPPSTINENLTQIIATTFSIIAVCCDNLPVTTAVKGNEILRGLEEHANKLRKARLVEVTPESRQVIMESTFAVANALKELMNI
ncbi:hypothetical protein HWV62_7433 [Athelia sp. TMB]|nr:hypothetical protein HWV62_7433 [Athelia sp. TMB]